ncbi:hypothetical protein SEA_CAMERICO_57 [Gordonia phage Camerico]|nr:hypothetical protein SEA_CAMERICO_57 [Gordonia phage Camerico]
MATRLDVDYQIVEDSIRFLSDNQVEILTEACVAAYLKKNGLILAEKVTETGDDEW